MALYVLDIFLLYRILIFTQKDYFVNRKDEPGFKWKDNEEKVCLFVLTLQALKLIAIFPEYVQPI